MISKRLKVLGILAGLALLGWAFFLKILSWVALSHTALGFNIFPKEFLVKPGASLTKITSNLVEKNLIKSPFSFRVYALLQGASQHLKAGEYLFSPYVTQDEILKALHKGNVLQHGITLPEGLTLEQAVIAFNTDPNLRGPLLSLKDLEQFPPLAETYFFTKETTRQALLQRMHKDLKNYLESLWELRDSSTPLKKITEVIVLAAIVEKETALPEERPLIAAVFLNRLRIGMPLQSDPTVSYGLFRKTGRPLNQALSRKQLKIPHDFNTYMNRGLPPQAIALVGKDSLKAVLSPAQSKDIYFVADGTGGHLFASTLKEHQRNHAQWRRIRKANKAV